MKASTSSGYIPATKSESLTGCSGENALYQYIRKQLSAGLSKLDDVEMPKGPGPGHILTRPEMTGESDKGWGIFEGALGW